MPDSVSVLITRPLRQAERLAETLCTEWGDRISVILSPLMQTVHLQPGLSTAGFSGIILSSEAGAEAASQMPGLPRPCFCVGERTAQAATRGGFDVRKVAPTAADLIEALLAIETGPLIYLHGRDVSVAVDRKLMEAGRKAEAAVVYDQVQLPLTTKAVEMLKRPETIVIPFYSARSVRLFLTAMPKDRKAILRSCAISSIVAEELPSRDRALCLIADTPDGQGMQMAMRRVISSLLG